MKSAMIWLLAAAVIIMMTSFYACRNMQAEDTSEHTEIINPADTIEIKDAAQVLRVAEELFNSFTELKKANDDYTLLSIRDAGNNAKIDSAQTQMLHAEKVFRQTLQKVELSNTNLQSQLAINSLYHIISSYRFLQKFQHLESVSANMIGSKNTYSPAMQKTQNNPEQELRIADLEEQVKFLQSVIKNSKKNPQPNLQQNHKNPAQETKIAELEKQVKFLQSANESLKNTLTLQVKPPQNQRNPAQEAKIAELEKKVKILQSNILDSKNTTIARIQQPQNSFAQELKIAALQKQVEFLKKNQNSKNNLSSVEYQEMASKIKYLNFDLRSVVKTNLDLNKQYEDLKKANLVLANELSKLRNRKPE